MLGLLFTVSRSGVADTAPEDEYRKLIKVSEAIAPLGDSPFGESVSAYDGTLVFDQNDVTATGMGPPLILSRHFKFGDFGDRDFYQYNAFGEWDINIPRITTEAAFQGGVDGWMTEPANLPTSKAICTNFREPPVLKGALGGKINPDNWTADQWWHGYQLVVPGNGTQELLFRAPENTISPQVPGKTFNIVTRNNWMITCLAQAQNDATREAFLAMSPDGLKYTFDHLAYRPYSTIRRDTGDQRMEFVVRKIASMFVTRIEDRFGNALTYTYDSEDKLTDITGTDGRSLHIDYLSGTPRISQVTLQPQAGAPRIWRYTYTGYPTGTIVLPGLADVQQPDGKHWTYDFAAFATSYTTVEGQNSSCGGELNAGGGSFSSSITHPSGLTGTFTMTYSKRGRSYVPKICVTYIANEQPDISGYATFPKAYYVQAITQKKYSGGGMTDQIWNYSYSAPNDSWNSDCTVTACASTIFTDEEFPDGHTERLTYSNKFDATEGRLLRTDTYAGLATQSALIRSETYDYADADSVNFLFPARIGRTIQSSVNFSQVNFIHPQKLRVLTQDGDTYTQTVEAFDAYAHPIRFRRESSTGTSVRDQTNYLNDQPHWLIDTPQSQQNLTKGTTVWALDFDLAAATPTARRSFGTVVMQYTYGPHGELTSFKDANGHITQLSNYKLGVPQNIAYPATRDFPSGTTQSVGVDDFGQVTSITNQAGLTTSYSYDSAGRVTSVVYPSGGGWASKTLIYDYLASDRGVSGNHWRRKVIQGNRTELTEFDALLRPVLEDTYRESDSALHITSLTSYDYRGNPVFKSYPVDGAKDSTFAFAGKSIQYDGLGRMVRMSVPSELSVDAVTTVAYLPGARTQFSDPLNAATTTSYLVFDEPDSSKPLLVQAPEGVTQTIGRDPYGSPTSILQTGPGVSHLKSIYYDDMHRPCRIVEPESGSEVISRDNVGNVIWTASGQPSDTACDFGAVSDGAKVIRSYSELNQLQAIAYPGITLGTDIHYTATGKVKSTQTGAATWMYAYNSLDLLSAESLNIDGFNFAFGYGYDADGVLATVHYPDGKDVNYLPDALGRPTQAGSYATGAVWHPDGDLAHLVYGNNVAFDQTKNTRNLINGFSYKSGASTDLGETLGYDQTANLISISDPSTVRNRTFTYDHLNRLTSSSAPNLWGDESYGYDALNNLTSMTSSGQASVFHYDGFNHLDQVRSQAGSVLTSYIYDGRGNVSFKNGTALTFDEANRLTSIAGTDSFDYDSAGRRVKKVLANGITTYYAYNTAGKLLWQFDPATTLATRYVYLGNRLVAEAKVDTSALDPSQVNVTLSMASPPTISADGSTFSVQIDIANNGTARLTSNSRDPVHLAGRIYTPAGALVAEMVPRANIPDVAPGSHAVATFTGAASQIVGTGNILKLILLQEGIAWFDAWGVQPVAMGPFSTCSFVSVYLCNTDYALQPNEAGSTLTVVAPPTLSSDGQTLTATLDVANTSYINFVSSGQYPINLGNHLADAAGNMVVNDITRAGLPVIPPGGHAMVSISQPAAGATGTGRLVQFELVQEGKAWFRSYGYGPVSVGPYGTLTVPVQSSSPSYLVQWSAVPGSSSYSLQEQINGGAWTTVQTANALSWTASGKTPATYGYRVAPCASACGPWSAVANVAVVSAPPAPSAISVPATSSGNIAIGWSTALYATSYTLEASFNGGTFTAVYTGAANSFGYTVGATGSYTYRVKACNSVGCSGYGPSGTSTITLPPASAPGISVPASSNNGCYTVNWSGVAGAASYTMQEQTNGGAFGTIANNGSGALGICGKSNGSYGYRVQACNVGGCGPWSGTATITVALLPAVPPNLNVVLLTPLYKGRYTVTWSAVALATRYEVQYKTPTDGWQLGYTGTATTYSGILISTNGQVQFEVRACNAVGCSAWSAPYSQTFSST